MLFVGICVATNSCANKTNDVTTAAPFVVFETRTAEAIPYRIPAIATAANGNIVAVADYRYSRADIGVVDSGQIDLRARISCDNGNTWGELFTLAQGQGTHSADFMHVGFGDPCIVADSESSRMLVLSCAGNVSFFNGTRENHQNIARFYSNDNGATWSAPVDIAESIYSQFDVSPYGPARSMFVGSGKISQSRTIKVGDYYRLYCAILMKDVNNRHCNFVLFSDDFGTTWRVLGGTDICPIYDNADEPKADELPDGSVLLSSRVWGGRAYNIFTYSNQHTAEGTWATSVLSNAENHGVVANENSTNGEILCLPAVRKSDNAHVWLLLQSVPFGAGRTNVGIYYKVLESVADYNSPENIAKDWDGRFQVSSLGSAYSTMTLQHNGTIGFLFEEDTYDVNAAGGYNIIYKNFTIEQITNDTYAFDYSIK